MSDLKQYMINRRDALLEINEFNMANEFEIILEDFAEQLSIPSSAEERYKAVSEVLRRRISDQQRYGTPVSNEIVKELRAVWNEIEALSPSGEQPKPKQRCPRCGNAGIHYCRPNEEDGE
ncbi:hypothetical protein H7B90_23695 [Cohnella xylanilytica]|uniref:Uncharacterized protein n=1 Tax=Cohnella xylanilytica TaxID=557555 RepID=A0A841U1J6_9BACL|nr:hypothetical protein [Cohnella xylanilytica]MBB6694405.1 hypothetical protein [Cohnella xylanilytica]